MRRGIIGSPSASCAVSARPWRLEQADHDVAAGVLLGMALEQHPERLADPRRHPEEHAEMSALTASVMAALARAVARGGALDVHAPSRLWTSRSISLIPMNGAMIPPSP